MTCRDGNLKNTLIMKKIYGNLALFCMATLAVACGGNENDNSVSDAKSDFVAERNLVDTMTLKLTSFNKEIVGNGNLRAVNRADLVFKSSGEIARVFRKNGERVAKGGYHCGFEHRQVEA